MALTTTWDEIRMTVLHKLFLPTSDVVVENDSNRDYLNAMPEEYNAAVMLLSTTNRYITKYFEVASTGLTDMLSIDLNNEVNDLYMLKRSEIYFIDDEGYYKVKDIASMGDEILVLDGRRNGVYRIYYYAYPLKATAKTEGTTDMQLDPDVAVLVPLYMASQLYKDDDIAIATQYRNEFEVGREELKRERNAGMGSRFTSVSGWW